MSKESNASTFTVTDTKATFVTDQELKVDGIHLREKRELTDLETEGNQQLVHTRWIEDKSYQVTKILSNGQEVKSNVNTEMSDSEAQKFETEWDEKWNPGLAAPGCASHKALWNNLHINLVKLRCTYIIWQHLG